MGEMLYGVVDADELHGLCFKLTGESILKLVSSISVGSRGNSSGISVGSGGSSISSGVSDMSRGNSVSSRGMSISNWGSSISSNWGGNGLNMDVRLSWNLDINIS